MNSCPVSHATAGSCPASSSVQYGPRGCAFAAFSPSAEHQLYVPPHLPAPTAENLAALSMQTIAEQLLPAPPPKEKTWNVPNADSLNPPELDVLAVALGAPARRVLQRADALGPLTGWRDGFLSTRHGFCPPDPNAAPAALDMCPGRVWSDLCKRLPGLVQRGRVREAILDLPLIDGSASTVPDAALWAAVVCLGIIASVYRYEDRNDGHEGLVRSPGKPADFLNVTGDAVDEEPETKGIPRNVVIPFRQICLRLGRPLPYLSQSDVSIHNFKIRDPTSYFPYLQRVENMDLRWPVFCDRGEAMFLLCMADCHGLFTPAVDLVARAQEMVMRRDNQALLDTLVALKAIIDQLPYAFHKISVNPSAGENFANPIRWSHGYAKFSAPLSKRVPALSGLFLPLFQMMDAFLGRTNFSSFLGIESIHLRAWMPLNIRAFLAAIEVQYRVCDYVRDSNDPKLQGVFDGIVEAYAGERGFMGTHRYKVYGFLEVVAKTGRVETNGGAGASDQIGRPWQEVHRTLAASMKERLEPYRKAISVEPHFMRGTHNECRFPAHVISRQTIDDDPQRSTAKITIDLRRTGITFQPGDRLAIMPLSSWREVEKIAGALGLIDLMDEVVPLDRDEAPVRRWRDYSKHASEVKGTAVGLTVRDILRRGQLSPITKDMVAAVHALVRVSSTTLRLLGSESWPITGSIGDVLVGALNDVPETVWDGAFDLRDLGWLPTIVPPEVPRTYSISSYSLNPLPETLDLTVSRAEQPISNLLTGNDSQKPAMRAGVSSGFLNPCPTEDHEPRHKNLSSVDDSEVLVGVSRPLNFQLPISAAVPVAMFAGGSGIAPFRGFWQARIASGGIGRNILFLGVQSRKKMLYKEELREHVLSGKLELHVAFSRDSSGLVYDPSLRDLVEKRMEPRYLDATIIDQGRAICDLVTSTRVGGLGGYLYVCGSVSLYETVISGIRQALYRFRAATAGSADSLLAAAFAERRFMLDIFMTPRPMSLNEPRISLANLAEHTGHRDGSRMWIGVHGSVYDVTAFLHLHPGGTLIVSASAGLDCSVTFDEVAHTSNPEVMSLLSKYFIGYLEPTPSFNTTELTDLFTDWVDYLRTSVENLTTIAFEVQSILKESDLWYSGGLLNIIGVRKFYQFQSRLMQNGFPTLFGAKLQELFVKLSFAVASTDDQYQIPDVIGTITHANSSAAAITARKSIAEIGEFIGSSATAQAFENGIVNFAHAVTELDVRFLEQVRAEIGDGLDAFQRVAGVVRSYPAKEKQALFKIATVLLKYLERIAERLDAFYTDLATHSLYNPAKEANPARARWNIIKRRIRDGSFFVFSREIQAVRDLDDSAPSVRSNESFRSARNKRQSITFDRVLAQAVESVSAVNRREERREARRQPTIAEDSGSESSGTSRRPGLAHAHTYRADEGNGESSYEEQVVRRAANRMSRFVTGRIKEIRRLSRTTATNFSTIEQSFKLPEPKPLNVRPAPRRQESLAQPPRREDSMRMRGPAVDTRVPARYTRSPVEISSYTPSEIDDGMSESGRTVRTMRSARQLDTATFSRKLSLKPSPREVTRKPSHW